MHSKKFSIKNIYAIYLLTYLSAHLSFAAPRAAKQHTTIKKITLQSLNIMTLHPRAFAAHHKKHRHTIHDICKRINKHINHHVINTTVSGNNDYYVHVVSGVVPVKDEVIFVYAGGWAGRPGSAHYKVEGQGLYSAYVNQKAGVMPGVCVCFDHITHVRSQATFGQMPDQYCLLLVMQEVRRVNPHASIVLVGSCAGAMTVINFIAEHPEKLQNVQAVILESPSISIERIEAHIMQSHFGKFGKNLPRFFKHYFSTYDPQALTILSTSCNIPHDLPILIGAITHDKTAAYGDVEKIVTALRDSRHDHVHLYSTDEPAKHGQLGKTEGWVAAIREFLYTYGIIPSKEIQNHEIT